MPLKKKIFGGMMAAESRERYRNHYLAKVELRQAEECKKSLHVYLI